jgi:hypothetical protein
MIRSRVIPAATLAVLALGAAWWWFATGLSAEERALVGKWSVADGPAESSVGEFTSDRRAVLAVVQRPPVGKKGGTYRYKLTGEWAAAGGTFAFDSEPSAFRRWMRPVAGLVGVTVNPTSTSRFEVAGDELVFVGSDGSRSTWTRVPAD